MSKKRITTIIIILISIIVVYKIAAYFGTKKVDEFLKSKNIKYAAVSVNFLLGNVQLENAEFVKDSLIINAKIAQLNGFSYYNYFKNKSFKIDDLIAENSKIAGKIIRRKKEETEKKDTIIKKLPQLEIENIQLKSLQIDVLKSDNFPLSVKNINLEINDFALDATNVKSMPFSYSNLTSKITKFDSQFSEVQKVTFSNLDFENDDISIDSLKIEPLKSREKYIYHVKEEKELLTLLAKKIIISDFKLEESEKVHFSSPNILVDEAFFNLYLDGTVLEHPNRRKDLYSKSLRELPIFLNVENIDIKNSKIEYEEYTIVGNKSGILVFDDLNAQIKNINNNESKKEKLTTVNIETKFMKSSPLNIKWNFDINNKNDAFRIQGSLLNVTSKSMSSFLLPTANVKMSGFINEMYFDFEGNDVASNGKLNMDFRNFDIKILDDKKEKKTVISWLVNLFIKDSSKNGMVKVEVKDLERDTTRSFWNYFWKSIEKGLQKSLI